jgi:autotransporter-associated beta strand protein
VLQLTGGSALEDATLVTLASTQASTLQLLASETLGRLAGGNATTDSVFGLVDLGSHVLTLRPTAAATYAGQLTGSGTLVKNGLVGETTFTGVSSGFTGLLRINQAGFALSGVGALNATRIEVNGAGFLLINNNGATRSSARIPDSTPLVLNSAAGTRFNETAIRGVWITTDQAATTSEQVGNLIFRSGASYLSGNAGGAGAAGLLATNFVRQNGATAIVRGRALGATTGDRNVFRISDATADAAFLAGLTGGAGVAGTATMSIVPWMVGENLSAGFADVNMGNTLVTYVTGLTLRPLNLATEYAAYATPGPTNNTRESLAGDLTGLTGRTVNSLSLHASSALATTYAVTGAGAGQSLTNTSGAFLFTLNPASTNSAVSRIDLGGFADGLLVGGTEYLFHVQNPSTAVNAGNLVVGVSSPLASAADLTKSGRGTLILSGVNLAGGGARRTVLNEGLLEIADLDAIGGDTGALIFAGGTLRFGSGFADDLFGRTITILEGGMGLDTNGVNQTITTALGTGVGRIAKFGLGDLTLNSPVSNGGPVLIGGGRVVFGVPGALANGWDLQLGEGVTTGSLDLGSSNFTVTALNALANNPLASVVTVAPGRLLRVEGDVLLSNRTDGGMTRLTLSGGGDLVVQGASITVGQNGAGTNISSTAILDLSDLASFTAELSNRLVIQLQGDNFATDYAQLILSGGPNLISAPSILIGASGTGSPSNALRLGPAANVLRTDLLYLGLGNRDSGRVEFHAAGGTFTLRNQAGDGRAQVTLGNNAAQTTGYTTTNVFELDGRVVDLAIGTYATAPFARGGASVHDFRFDAGVVDILQLNLAVAKGTGASTSLFRIGGGELRLGGSAAFGDTGTGSVSLGAAASGELRIDGGVVLATVPVGRSAGAGTATLTLSGGVLDLGGNDLGSAALPLTLALTAGTLRNYGQFNGGQALVKTGSGTLMLDGTSGHVAGITITAGILQVGAGGSTGTLGNSDVSNSGTLAFDRTGTLVVPGAITGTGGLRKGGAGTVVLTGTNSLAGATLLQAGILQLGAGGATGSLLTSGFTLDAGATLRFDRSDSVDFSTTLSGAVGSVIEQAGAGRTRLTSANLAFAGDIRVSAGELEATVIDALSAARQLIVANGATLTLSVNDATGYGLGPDLSLEGGLLRFLAGSGDAVSASLRDMALAGGEISAGLAVANTNSLVIKGRIDVIADTTVSARQVALGFAGTAAVATEVSVSTGRTLAFTGTLADDRTAMLPTAFDKRGAGTLVLSGNNVGMTGASTLTAGVVDVRHVNALGDGVTVGPTFSTSSLMVTGGSLVSNQANFVSAGAVRGDITIGVGGSIGVTAPGVAVIGNLQVASLTLQGGSRIDFKLWDRAGGLGVGFDRLDLGAVDLRGASPTSRITLKLISMSSANAFGESTLVRPVSPLDFTSFAIGSYDTANSQLGANVSDLFRFDATDFDYAGGTASDAGLWRVEFNAGAITLTAVPEPSTYGLGLGALALAAAAIRRRKRQEKKA